MEPELIMTSPDQTPGHSVRPDRARPSTMRRLAVSVAVGVIVAAITVPVAGWRYAPGTGWDATAIVFCGLIWLRVWPLSAAQARDHATAEDPNRPVSDILTLSASVASLAAIAVILASAKASSGMTEVALACWA